MKKINSILLSIMIILLTIPMESFAETEEIKASFIYTNIGVTAEIDGIPVASTETGWNGDTSGNGFSLNGTTVTIDAAGEFTFSGTCDNGNIYVPKGEGDENREIEIILEGLNLTEPDLGQCPIEIKGGTNRASISAKKNTENTLTDAYHNAESPKACINASKKIELKGKGKLTVNGNNKNGIKSDTKINIKNLDLSVNSVGDAIKADEELKIESGKITVNASDDAIKATELVTIGDSLSETSGEPVIKINNSYEGIESKVIDIQSGDIKVRSTDDAINAAKPKENTCPGYDAECQVFISSGRLDLIGGNDGIDSNGDIFITGGDLIVFTTERTRKGNAAIDMEKNLYINGGRVFAADYNEGLMIYSTPTIDSQRYFSVSEEMSSGEIVSISDNGTELTYTLPIDALHFFYTSPTLTEENVLNQDKPMTNPFFGGGGELVVGGGIDNEISESTANASAEPVKPSPVNVKVPTIKKLITGKKSFTITWKKVKKIDGYQLQYSTSKTFKKSARVTKTIGKTKTSYKAKSLKAGKRYYVRMRGYKLVDGKKKCGGWSEVTNIKIKE